MLLKSLFLDFLVFFGLIFIVIDETQSLTLWEAQIFYGLREYDVLNCERFLVELNLLDQILKDWIFDVVEVAFQYLLIQ